jgi:hypothetical protein
VTLARWPRMPPSWLSGSSHYGVQRSLSSLEPSKTHNRVGDHTRAGPGRLLARWRLAPCALGAAVSRHCAREARVRPRAKAIVLRAEVSHAGVTNKVSICGLARRTCELRLAGVGHGLPGGCCQRGVRRKRSDHGGRPRESSVRSLLRCAIPLGLVGGLRRRSCGDRGSLQRTHPARRAAASAVRGDIGSGLGHPGRRVRLPAM